MSTKIKKAVLSVALIGAVTLRRIKKKWDHERKIKKETYTKLTKVIHPNTTLFVGDSITQQHPVEDLYQEFDAVNRGVNGDTTEDILERFDEHVIAARPKTIVMLMGINDIAKKTSVEDIAKNVETMITKIQVSLPNTRTILLATFPINKSHLINHYVLINRDNETVDELNKIYQSLALSKGIEFYNLNEYLSDEHGDLKSEFTTDGLHINIDAYVEIEKHLSEILRQKLK